LYRILDGANRWSAYKSTGKASVEAIVQELTGIDPLFFYMKLPARNLKLETRNKVLLPYAVEFHRSLCPQDMGVYMKLPSKHHYGSLDFRALFGYPDRNMVNQRV
jgi:hypothetical protein